LPAVRGDDGDRDCWGDVLCRGRSLVPGTFDTCPRRKTHRQVLVGRDDLVGRTSMSSLPRAPPSLLIGRWRIRHVQPVRLVVRPTRREIRAIGCSSPDNPESHPRANERRMGFYRQGIEFSCGTPAQRTVPPPVGERFECPTALGIVPCRIM
jgi:hypothetical protein